MAAAMPAALVVIHAFGSYQKGQMIVDAATISSILGGGLASFVVPTTPPTALHNAASEG